MTINDNRVAGVRLHMHMHCLADVCVAKQCAAARPRKARMPHWDPPIDIFRSDFKLPALARSSTLTAYASTAPSYRSGSGHAQPRALACRSRILRIRRRVLSHMHTCRQAIYAASSAADPYLLLQLPRTRAARDSSRAWQDCSLSIDGL